MFFSIKDFFCKCDQIRREYQVYRDFGAEAHRFSALLFDLPFQEKDSSYGFKPYVAFAAQFLFSKYGRNLQEVGTEEII